MPSSSQPEKRRGIFGMGNVTNGQAWQRTAMGSLVSAVATLGGVIGYLQINPPRPDPFTGAQAESLRREIKMDIQRYQAEIETEILRLENRQFGSEENIGDIWRAMSVLPPDRWRRRIEALEIEAIKKNPDYDVPQ